MSPNTTSNTRIIESNKDGVEFDFDIATVLATVAFGAYAGTEGHGLVLKSTPSEGLGCTKTIYTDEEFLHHTNFGVLKVSYAHIEDNCEGESYAKESKVEEILVTCGSDSQITTKANNEPELLLINNLDRAEIKIKICDGNEDGQCIEKFDLQTILKDQQKTNGICRFKKRISIPSDPQKNSIELCMELFSFPRNAKHLESENHSALEEHVKIGLSQQGPGLMSEDWRQLLSSYAINNKYGCKPVAFIENDYTDTQLWIYWDMKAKLLVISFRGTEQDKWKDLLTDLSLKQVAINAATMEKVPNEDFFSMSTYEERVDIFKDIMEKLLPNFEEASDNRKKTEQRKVQDGKQALQNLCVFGTTAVCFLSCMYYKLNKWKWIVLPLIAYSVSKRIFRFFYRYREQNNRWKETKSRERSKSSNSGSRAIQEQPELTIHNEIRSKTLTFNHFKDAKTMEGKGKADSVGAVDKDSLKAESNPEADPCLIHSGFFTAYSSVRHQVINMIASVVALDHLKNEKICSKNELESDENSKSESPRPQHWTVAITGHSLGGALATLAAMDIAQQKNKLGDIKIKMYNFGSPRVGNQCFSKLFDLAVPDSWRVVNANDSVTKVPRPFMGYHHVGHLVAVDKDGSVRMQHSKEVPFESTTLEDITPLVKEIVKSVVNSSLPPSLQGAQEQANTLETSADTEIMELHQEVSQQLAEGIDENKSSLDMLHELWSWEKKNFGVLFTAEALQEHMEEEYFSGRFLKVSKLV